MTTYRRYTDFTAQGINVRALMSLYADFEGRSNAELTPFVVFLAFSVESYLNSLGARHLTIWEEVEKLPWRSKVEILHKTSQKKPNWGKEPLQFAAEVFRLRDKLAHGKPERIFELPEPSAGNAQYPPWFAGIDRAWVLAAKERFHVLMVYLADLFNLPESDHLHLSTGGIILDDGGGA